MGLELAGAGNYGAVFGALRERFVQADQLKSGFLDRAQFKGILASFPGTDALSVSCEQV